jgi:glutamate-5-semialdehyde dehydrogenase
MSLLINEEAAVGETAVHLRAIQLADAARAASRLVAAASAEKRTQAIELLAAKIDEPAFRQQLLTSNAGDVAQAREAGQTAAWLDRLSLDEKRLDALSRGLREVAAQPDPVGEVTESRTRPNGLRVEKIRSPLGSILMIYEARPNVTADAAALCLRAGNAALLRGGKEAQRSNALLIQAAQGALEQAGLPRDAVQFVEPDRALLDVLLTLEDRIDLCIPRGGPSLVRKIAEQSRIPVVKHYQGVCHLYVAPDADPDLAELLAVNGKAQRPSVCNALEALLIDSASLETQLPRLARALWVAGVELRCDARSLPVVEISLEPETRGLELSKLNELLERSGVPPGRSRAPALAAVASDYGNEFGELKLLVAVVDGLEGALAHIAKWGSRHTEAICTTSPGLGDEFVRRVDASCAVINASTRFNDGGELGLGAEIGISTSKLHAYGPMGAQELTCTRFVVRGAGQART